MTPWYALNKRWTVGLGPKACANDGRPLSDGIPYWLVVAGAILMVIGFIGLAYRQRRRAEVKRIEMGNENEPGVFEFEADFAQTRAHLAEQTRDRWANKQPQYHRGNAEQEVAAFG